VCFAWAVLACVAAGVGEAAVAHRDLAPGESPLLGQCFAGIRGLFGVAENVDGQAMLHGCSLISSKS
jgi:hypothetical protein